MPQDLFAAIQAAIEDEMISQAQKAQVAARRANSRYNEMELEMRKKIVKEAADHFYKDYPPKFYKESRRGSLYQIFNVETTPDIDGGIEAYKGEFDEDAMPYRNGNAGKDGLYQTVFHEGWHGGAASGPGHPQYGTPYWRTPYPKYNKWGSKAAKAEISPFDEMILEDEHYTAHDMENDLWRFWNEEWAKINQ